MKIAQLCMCVQELHFVSAPHTLQMLEGQSVAMRAWWCHSGHADTDDTSQKQEPLQQQDSTHDKVDGNWHDSVVADWQASLKVSTVVMP